MRKFARRFGWIRASKLRLPESTEAQTSIVLNDGPLDILVKGAGVADAGGAAVGGDTEAQLFQIGSKPAFSISRTTREPGASDV